MAVLGLLISAPAAYFAAQKFFDHKETCGMEPLDPSDPRLGDCLTRECAVLAVLAPAPPAASAGLETPPVAQTTPDPLY